MDIMEGTGDNLKADLVCSDTTDDQDPEDQDKSSDLEKSLLIIDTNSEPELFEGEAAGSPKEEEKTFYWSICGEEFPLKKTLKRQRVAHAEDKSYPCNICGKVLGYKKSLKMHQRAHTGDKPYSCNICSKMFSYKQSLTRHMRVHTGDKPFSCEICHKRFTQDNNLKRHMKNHVKKEDEDKSFFNTSTMVHVESTMVHHEEANSCAMSNYEDPLPEFSCDESKNGDTDVQNQSQYLHDADDYSNVMSNLPDTDIDLNVFGGDGDDEDTRTDVTNENDIQDENAKTDATNQDPEVHEDVANRRKMRAEAEPGPSKPKHRKNEEERRVKKMKKKKKKKDRARKDRKHDNKNSRHDDKNSASAKPRKQDGYECNIM
eukprot:TRINITY_DN4843_c0_g2_i1.p1 TRINITY_DN4843_c0_g2~~TRINITY_DN4843_c0_g2_i1.p1  ORF type:complete len:373 (-),score=72.40 TRINITY_DN4843_c0_g2_i1:6-1124(-)